MQRREISLTAPKFICEVWLWGSFFFSPQLRVSLKAVEGTQAWVLLRLENSVVQVQAIYFFLLDLNVLICKMGAVGPFCRIVVVTGDRVLPEKVW